MFEEENLPQEELQPQPEPVVEVEEPEATIEEKEPEKTPSPKEKTPAWFQRRIDKEVAEKHALRRQIEQLQSQPVQEPAADSEEIDRRANEKAAELARQRAFDEACNRTFDQGVAEFSDFSSNLKELKNSVGELPVQLVHVINDLDNGHKVLNHLATNLDDAARIYELSPTRMAIELTKLSDKLSKPPVKPISKVPPPIKPVSGGSVTPDGLSDSLSDDEWIKRRNAQRRSVGRM